MQYDEEHTDAKLYLPTTHLSDKVYDNSSKTNDNIRVMECAEVVPEISASITTTLENDINGAAFSKDILPTPGTRVTTTVRTFTYEVPADTSSHSLPKYDHLQQNINLKYNERSERLLPTTQPVRTVPETMVCNTESYSTINNNNEKPITSTQVYEFRRKEQENNKQMDVYRNDFMRQTHNQFVDPNNTGHMHLLPEIINYSVRSTLDNSSQTEPNSNRYFYKESTNEVGTIERPGFFTKTKVLQGPTTPLSPRNKLHFSGYPLQDDGYISSGIPNTSTVTCNYLTSTMNSSREPQYQTPFSIMQPSPFPVDYDYSIANGNPPHKVDDLMQSFRNTETVDSSEINSLHRKREIETAVAASNQQMIPSVNKAGKEVYYPPEHEIILTKREEMAAESATGGRWAKGSGMNEYQSRYKTKINTKSGGAMVPVCLPLCCAMPCSIM